MAEEKQERPLLQPVNAKRTVVERLNERLQKQPGVDQWQFVTAAIEYALDHNLKIVGVHLVEEATKGKTK